MFKLQTILFILLISASYACGDDGGDNPDGDSMTSLGLTFDGLPELGADYVYEGWLITDTGPVSTGRFTVDAQGNLDPADFEVLTETADQATAFVLTIEPATGDDPAPADTHILAGPAESGASLSVDHMAAIGTDFAGAAGSFVLNTPTTGSDDSDYTQGIWWLEAGATMTAALDLPTLPAGWVYEGWVVTEADGPISTGTFTDPATADSDGAGPTAGSDGFPPFPGQDFIDPAIDLEGATAVISVEPEPDDSPMPFIIKPLVDMEIADVAPPGDQSMSNNAAATIPSGSLTLQIAQ